MGRSPACKAGRRSDGVAWDSPCGAAYQPRASIFRGRPFGQPMELMKRSVAFALRATKPFRLPPSPRHAAFTRATLRHIAPALRMSRLWIHRGSAVRCSSSRALVVLLCSTGAVFTALHASVGCKHSLQCSHLRAASPPPAASQSKHWHLLAHGHALPHAKRTVLIEHSSSACAKCMHGMHARDAATAQPYPCPRPSAAALAMT